MMETRPDRLEYIVRFVCGGLVGGLISLFLAGNAALPPGQMLLSIGVAAVALGGCAAWFGDRFWHVLVGLFSW